MSAVNPDVKAALVASGRWGDFVRAKSDLAAGGVSPAEARQMALERVAPELAGVVAEKRSRGRPSKAEKERIVAACEESVVESSQYGRKRASAGVEKEMRVVASADREGRGGSFAALSREAFVGRTCSMRDAVVWVLSNLCFDPSEVNRGDAPSALAVTYYDACISSPSFRADFLLKVGPMLLPKKFEEEKSGGDDFTGKAEYDLLGAIAGGAE